ncbi:arf-GAP with Rho-GAP domain, ANK repeat and PH domain-containing protein 1 [Myxocyprinus asiaticus]|uniref:arf-GAP with Rho-GAP domain, ANK repeat and PH domain-containing protein 1 n=1 Tax=Myxocyprinus asiaticus TaxID=70543 RepID=UPI002222BC8B|nr:arf-GAP with Rho-GAP domain, ANK repeat and PH domain-containing protein 1 [Myxocyprinus asiaticus]
MSMSDIIPVPKPRARYLFGVGVRKQPSSDSDGVGQLACPHIQVVTEKNSEVETDEEHEVSLNDPSCQLNNISTPPGLQKAVETNCSETSERFSWPLSTVVSPGSFLESVRDADSESSDDSIVTPDSPKSHNAVNEVHNNSDRASSIDQVIDVQTGPVTNGDQVLNSQNFVQNKLNQPKKPRAATIRVSRKKQTLAKPGQRTSALHSESVVVRASWLDVWKGRKHNVLWATLDGQLMSLWKKRTDKFTEYVFHVTSITDVRKQDHGHFSIYFRKKHLDFMDHTVQEGWVASLLASRGGEPAAPPKQHGPLTMKDPRKKMYAASCGHNLWIYRSKEDFSLGLGMTCVSMNIASVKPTGHHSFSLITPYRTFNFSADSAKEANMWLDCLNEVIRSALSCSEVAHRLWSSPWNKVCADCGAANPEWASVNLLVVICEACASAHRSLGSNRSKVRSLKLDNKVWTAPLLQLFVLYGNKAANSVWGHNIPAVEQIGPDVSTDQRAEFILTKYCKGLYCKVHPLATNQKLLDQRLREVVCGPNVEETLSLLCSGARVLCSVTDPEYPSAISVAESSGQALQTELLRHNEFVEAPDFDQMRHSEELMGVEELHGKLDEERFLFSQENESAACDVLDLTEVISVFDCSAGQIHEFEMLTLTDRLICSADRRDVLLTHMLHIMKIVLGGVVVDEDLLGVFAVSRASIREGAALQCAEVWCTLQTGEMIIYTQPHISRDKLQLNAHTRCYLQQSENAIVLQVSERTLHMQFELQYSCLRLYELVQRVTCSTTDGQQHASVPCAIDRCMSHITQYGLNVEGLYRRCGIAPQISKLVEALHVSPRETLLDKDELSILDVAGALKQILRETVELIPQAHKQHWLKAAALPDEMDRHRTYHRLVNQLPPDNRVTLAALCGHLHTVQLHSEINLMTGYNLAVVFVATLFQELAMNTTMVHLTRELIIHHTHIFTGHEERDGAIITVL